MDTDEEPSQRSAVYMGVQTLNWSLALLASYISPVPQRSTWTKAMAARNAVQKRTLILIIDHRRPSSKRNIEPSERKGISFDAKE